MGSSIRIVVADDNEIIRQMIVDSLCEDDGIEVVGEASDGATAVKLIKETRPDIVLLDLVMPLVDGIGVMEYINSDETFKERKPQYVVISAAGSEDIVNQALQTGASYFIMKPFDGDALIKRIKRIAGEMESVGYQGIINGEIKEGTMSIEHLVINLLRNLGVPVRMVGYKYLRDAIMISIEDADSLMSVTKNIYPEIAAKHGTSPGNVERNIRYVIESTWSRREDDKYRDAIKGIFKGAVKKPTNSEFILICSEWIHYQLKK